MLKHSIMLIWNSNLTMYSVFFWFAKSNTPRYFTTRWKCGVTRGAVRNESEAILEMKNTSNPPPQYREWRLQGDVLEAQSEPQKWWGPAKHPGPWHTVRFEFNSPIHKSRCYSWLFGHRPQQPQGECVQLPRTLSFPGTLPKKETVDIGKRRI